jgi:hypothetical protein
MYDVFYILLFIKITKGVYTREERVCVCEREKKTNV